MINRRVFVTSLGWGAVSGLTVGNPTAAAPQQSAAARRQVIPLDAIRIGSNENPHGPSAAAADAARQAIPEGHRYAGAVSGRLLDAVAAAHRVPPEQVLLSGGSGDLLRAAVRAFTARDRALVTGAPSYEQPVRIAQQSGAPVHEVALTGDLKLDLAAMHARSGGAGLVYVCNPNNPTSTVVPSARVRELIEELARTSPQTMVLVDEAYFEYVDEPGHATLIPLVDKHPALIIARTFSKIHGMAGMRVGYAIAQEKARAAIRDQHSGSGISVMSFAAAAASISDVTALQRNQVRNRETRAFTTAAFTDAGYRVAASQANFVMVDIRRDVRPFMEALRAKGVYIGRPFPPLTNWARISVGTQAEMAKALPIILDVLEAPPTTAFRVLPAVYASWC